MAREHDFMLRGERRQTIPSNGEFSVAQLKFLFRQVETTLGRKISLNEWENL